MLSLTYFSLNLYDQLHGDMSNFFEPLHVYEKNHANFMGERPSLGTSALHIKIYSGISSVGSTLIAMTVILSAT